MDTTLITWFCICCGHTANVGRHVDLSRERCMVCGKMGMVRKAPYEAMLRPSTPVLFPDRLEEWCKLEAPYWFVVKGSEVKPQFDIDDIVGMTTNDRLLLSAAKFVWIAGLDKEFFRPNAISCPLCMAFNTGLNWCEGCPVYKESGRPECRNTPWFRIPLDSTERGWKPACLEEARYLISLMDESHLSLFPWRWSRQPIKAAEPVKCERPHCRHSAECMFFKEG